MNYTDIYDRMWARKEYRVNSPELRARDKLLGIIQGIEGGAKKRRVLSCGCGSGIGVWALRKQGVDAYGIDVSEVALTTAEGVRQPEHYFRVADLTQVRFPVFIVHPRFDLAYAIDVLEHIAEEDLDAFFCGMMHHNPRFMYFEVALKKESHGKLIGEDLHPTVRSAEFWNEWFEARCDVIKTDIREGKGLLAFCAFCQPSAVPYVGHRAANPCPSCGKDDWVVRSWLEHQCEESCNICGHVIGHEVTP